MRELNEVLAILEEDLGDRVAGYEVVRGSSGERQAGEVGPESRHAEARHDLAARQRDRRGDALEPAVAPDLEGHKVVLGVRTVGVDVGLEDDCLVVDERRATGEKERPGGGGVGRLAGGKVRQLCALAGREVEHDDLGRILAPGPWLVVSEGDPPAVRAEGDRRGEGPESTEARLVARRAEATGKSSAVGA